MRAVFLLHAAHTTHSTHTHNVHTYAHSIHIYIAVCTGTIIYCVGVLLLYFEYEYIPTTVLPNGYRLLDNIHHIIPGTKYTPNGIDTTAYVVYTVACHV